MADNAATPSKLLPTATARDLLVGDAKGLTVALAGAGGKHTLMEALLDAGKLGAAPMIVTSTTRLHRTPCFNALPAVYWESPQADSLLKQSLCQNAAALVVAKAWGEQMWIGVSPESVSSIRHAAPDACILAKADGARKRLLKVPGDNEPAWPKVTDVAILVLSLAACGKPLQRRWVHRVERVEALTRNGRIGPDTLVDVVLGAGGYDRRFPPTASRVLYLSSCGSVERLKLAYRISESLSPHFERIVAGDTPEGRFLSLHQSEATSG